MKKNKEIIFTVIDQGVLSNPLSYAGKKCDAMLTSCQMLFLVELKVKTEKCITPAMEQLEATIEVLRRIHPHIDTEYTTKKAFICNKKHPKLGAIDNSTQRKLYCRHKFRFHFGAEIKFE